MHDGRSCLCAKSTKKQTADWESNLQSELVAQEICTRTPIRANLAVLAIEVDLAIGGVPTTLSRTMLTPAIHKFLDNFDITIEVADVTARRSACRNLPLGAIKAFPILSW